MVPSAHEPVLLEDCLRFLACRPGSRVVDCTVGGGGHAEGILQRMGKTGFLLALDRDPDAVQRARERLSPWSPRVQVRVGDFRRLPETLQEQGWKEVDGILVDLGLSSVQLEDPARGFSFTLPGPLDMRYDRSRGETAEEIVNESPEEELRGILQTFGEEPMAARIARRIVRERSRVRLRTTRQLAGLLEELAGRGRRRIHPATRTFQALRIAVNRELEGLEGFLQAAAGLLAPEGRIVVIAFHSLEDRIVKRTLAGLTPHCVCPPRLPVCECGRPGILRLLTRRPLRPSPEERSRNPRARSARLRAAERIPAPSSPVS